MSDEMKEPECKTAADARYRLSHARIGSLVTPTHEYLLTLRNGIHSWLASVEKEMALLAEKDAAIEAGERDAGTYDDPRDPMFNTYDDGQ